jgi:hypothetical protein
MSAPQAHGEPAGRSDRISLEFAGEFHHAFPGDVLTVGREGTLAIDDNPFLHRHFLRISRSENLWWLANVGTRLSATVTDGGGRVQSWLAPGARLPIVFHATYVIFTAGPTTYEMRIFADAPSFEEMHGTVSDHGTTTVGTVNFTPSQHLLLVALAEPMLRREGAGMSSVPSSAEAAKRLKWTVTRFNRKLDNVCEKLDKVGVSGLRGRGDKYATNRRARLVEYVLAARLVSRADLELLDRPQQDDADDTD